MNAINALSFGYLDIACEGGWGINTFYALNPTVYTPGYGFFAAAMSRITRDDAIVHPLFTPFRAEADSMHSTNLFAIADETYRKDLRAKFLGDAIPARSFAAGRNAIEVFEHIPMMQHMAHVEDWPDKDGSLLLWKHSSLKNIAYFFVHKLFNRIVEGQ